MSVSSKVEGFIDRVSAMADKSTAMRRLSGWMTRNLKLDGRPYTFKDHEMQADIASDQHPDIVVKKCSQIGLTELSLRITAAIAAVTRSRIIYIFPSAKFSVKVSTDRFTPIIHGSPILMAMQHSDSKSAEMRKLGNTTIYFQGASGTTQAISVPATHLMIDEKDFCDQVILGQFNSRLRHAEEDPETGLQGHKRSFSTPTLPNYGISKDFEESDQKSYTVKCGKCNTVQVPNYYQDYVIPGYDSAMEMFGKDELNNPKYAIDKAYVKCQKCGKDLWNDLVTPEKRLWIAKYPERRMSSGYAISPIDVPKYNKIPSIIRQIGRYTTQDHRNFVLGLEHEDKHNSFMESIFDGYTDAFFMSLEEARASTLTGIRIGADIGKVAHLVVGKRISSNTKDMHVLHAATLSIQNGPLSEQIQKYVDAFTANVTVLDSAPDFSTPQALIADNRYGTVYGCEYTRSVSENFTNIAPRPEDGVVKAYRSGTLSTFMAAHNSGYIHYPKGCKEVDVIKAHLKATKKLTKPSEFGDVMTFPKPDMPDHYAHAMNYMLIADDIASDHNILPVTIGVLPSITGVTIGSSAK